MSFLERNIRTLLTVKYSLVVALLMFLYSSVNLVFQYYYLREQTDLNLTEDLEIIEDILATNEVIISPLHRRSEHEPKPYERFVEIWSEDGTVMYHSSAFEFESLPPPPKPERYNQHPRFFSFAFPDGEQWRTIGVKLMTPNGVRIVRISMSEQHLYDQLWEIFGFMSLLTPFFLVFSVLSGYILARQALKPIDGMMLQAKRIGTENLRERLSIMNPNDELGQLASVTNDLLDRIQRSFLQLKNFTADASHELRTPLTAMRSVGEVGLQPGQPPEYYREVIGSMLEENNRLTHLVDSLLFLSKADSEKIPLQIETTSMLLFLQESVEILGILAEEKHQSLSVECDPALTVTGDLTLLRRAVMNLIDNAIKYTPDRGTITVRGTVVNDRCIMTVTDSGPGIPENERERIFDRFYRLDKNRSRETGGVGLGLSIVHWVMAVHRGTVRIEGSRSGSTFILDIPSPPDVHAPGIPL